MIKQEFKKHLHRVVSERFNSKMWFSNIKAVCICFKVLVDFDYSVNNIKYINKSKSEYMRMFIEFKQYDEEFVKDYNFVNATMHLILNIYEKENGVLKIKDYKDTEDLLKYFNNLYSILDKLCIACCDEIEKKQSNDIIFRQLEKLDIVIKSIKKKYTDI
jgi:hypothetical protein